MPRKRNPVATVKLELSTTQVVIDLLGRLVASGLFGKNIAEAAERILGERLRSLKREDETLFGKKKS